MGGAGGRAGSLSRQAVWSVVLLAGSVGWGEQLERGAPFHHWHGLCLADVEGQRPEPVDQGDCGLEDALLCLGLRVLAVQLRGDLLEQNGVLKQRP